MVFLVGVSDLILTRAHRVTGPIPLRTDGSRPSYRICPAAVGHNADGAVMRSRFSARLKAVILERVVVSLLALRNRLMVLCIYHNGKVRVAPSHVLYHMLCPFYPFWVLCPLACEPVPSVRRVESRSCIIDPLLV